MSQRFPRKIHAAPASTSDTTQIGPRWLQVLLASASTVTLAIGAFAWVTVGQLGSEVASASNLNLRGGNARELGADGATDILLVGSDSRTDAQGNPLSEQELARLNAGTDEGALNTDTIMIIRVPNDGTRATAVSVPRDTYVRTKDFGNTKINGVYGMTKAQRRQELLEQNPDADPAKVERLATEAGRKGLIEVLGDLTGVDIDHYAEVGLHGFVMLTDAVGGVDVCLNEAVSDEFSGASFPAGPQTLNGTDALAFVRQRHGLPRGDLDRVVRQQAYMASLVGKVLSSDVLTSPSRLNELADAVGRSVVIDEGWDIVSFGLQLANLAAGDVTFTTIPLTSANGVGDYGESIVTVDVSEVHDFMDSLNEPAPEEAPAPRGDGKEPAPEPEPNPLKGIGVHVLNAGAPAGHAGAVGQWLREQDVSVVEVANAIDGIYSYSQVVAADKDSPAARALAEMLGGLPISISSSLDGESVVVVTTADYTGPISHNAQSDLGYDEPVGTPGEDFGHAAEAPEMTASRNDARCVN